jgi:hypothetical protein
MLDKTEMMQASADAGHEKRKDAGATAPTAETPRQEARAHAHSVMFNYVCERPPGGHIPRLEVFYSFARQYNENLVQKKT